MKRNRRKIFVVFPSFTYWEIDGKPVSSREADYGLNPKAILKLTDIALHPEKYC